MVQIYRCRICGEAHVMGEKPTHCPFCGAGGKWLVTADEYCEPVFEELSEVSRKNLVFTYDLEIQAARIYHCIRKKSKDEFIVGMFKAISKVELEHAELVGKLIGRDPGCDIALLEDLCSAERHASLKKTEKLEAMAIEHYRKFLRAAVEPRVKEVFTALLEAENDHLALVRRNL